MKRSFGLNCMDDPASPHVTYGRPAPSGSSGTHIVVPTLADELGARRPGTRVAVMGLKPRSTIPLAGRGGVVTWFDDKADSFVTARPLAAEPVKEVKDFIVSDPVEKDLGQVLGAAGPRSFLPVRRCRGRRTASGRVDGALPPCHRRAHRRGCAVLRALAEEPVFRRVSRTDGGSTRRLDAARQAGRNRLPGAETVLDPGTSGRLGSSGARHDVFIRPPGAAVPARKRHRKGRFAAHVSPADIAPTLAALAGLPLPNAEGRVLREALSKHCTSSA